MQHSFRTLALVAALSLPLVAAAQTASPSSQIPAANAPAATPEAVRQADIQFARATAEQGLEGWMQFFADDAYVGTNPSIQGKLQLRRFYQRVFSRRDLKFQWAPDHAEMFPSGNLGYTSGRYTMTFTNFQGGTVSQTGSYVTIWQKQPDGSWKVLSDFGSQDKSPLAPEKTSDKPEKTSDKKGALSPEANEISPK